mgnify:CR=1 FL=1
MAEQGETCTLSFLAIDMPLLEVAYSAALSQPSAQTAFKVRIRNSCTTRGLSTALVPLLVSVVLASGYPELPAASASCLALIRRAPCLCRGARQVQVQVQARVLAANLLQP